VLDRRVKFAVALKVRSPPRLLENVREPRKRKIVLSIAFFR
jgi:hypothetical protein